MLLFAGIILGNLMKKSIKEENKVEEETKHQTITVLETKNS